MAINAAVWSQKELYLKIQWSDLNYQNLSSSALVQQSKNIFTTTEDQIKCSNAFTYYILQHLHLSHIFTFATVTQHLSVPTPYHKFPLLYRWSSRYGSKGWWRASMLLPNQTIRHRGSLNLGPTKICHLTWRECKVLQTPDLHSADQTRRNRRKLTICSTVEQTLWRQRQHLSRSFG